MIPQTQINLFGQKYPVGLPNVGQRLEIESRKQVFSNGLYGTLAKSDHIEANRLLNIIDAVSTFGVLLPQFNMTAEKFQAISSEESLEWASAYIEYYKFERDTEKAAMDLLTSKTKNEAKPDQQ